MTKKTSFDSWISLEEESSWANGMTNPTGMHIVPEWEIKTPAPRREVVWGHDRDTPIMTVIGPKEASDIAVTTRNLWNLRPLFFLLSGGSYTPAGSSGIISASSGAIKSFAVHANSAGTETTFIGCAMEEVTINIPKEGGNLTLEWMAKAADFVAEGKTKPTIISEGLYALDGVYTFYKGGAAITDVFQGGSLKFSNNLNIDVPDLPNGRIYQPSVQNLGVTFEGDFRIDSADNFLHAHESGLTGVFDIYVSVKDADSTGFVIELTGMQLSADGFSEPIPTAEKGIIEQTVTFIQSEGFILKDIQVTGVDFT